MTQLTFDEVVALAPPSPEPEPFEPTPEGRAVQARIALMFAELVTAAEAWRANDARGREEQP